MIFRDGPTLASPVFGSTSARARRASCSPRSKSSLRRRSIPTRSATSSLLHDLRIFLIIIPMSANGDVQLVPALLTVLQTAWLPSIVIRRQPGRRIAPGCNFPRSPTSTPGPCPMLRCSPCCPWFRPQCIALNAAAAHPTTPRKAGSITTDSRSGSAIFLQGAGQHMSSGRIDRTADCALSQGEFQSQDHALTGKLKCHDTSSIVHRLGQGCRRSHPTASCVASVTCVSLYVAWVTHAGQVRGPWLRYLRGSDRNEPNANALGQNSSEQ